MIINEVRRCLKSVKHTFHAIKEEFNDNLTAKQIEDALIDGFEVVEDYPDDPRGHSCLLLIWVKGKPVHITCAPHEGNLIIITVYVPVDDKWENNFKTRKLK
jgi:uncharacterized protein (UPF0305 family)